MNDAKRVPDDTAKLLSIYLRDHLAGAAGGVALFKRAAGNTKDAAHRELLERLAGEVAENARQLRRIARVLGVRRPRMKEFVVLAGERAARGKLNGRIFRRSPSSAVVEAEAMILGVTGQMLVWRSLAASDLADALPADTDLGRLEARAVEQRLALEQLHQDVIHAVFASPRSGARSV